MEFEEMQAIWNAETNEKMYVINEEVLHKQVQKKSESADRKVDRFEMLLIIANLFAATILTIGAIVDGDIQEKLIISAVYAAFGLFGLVRRFRRQREVKQFDQTVVGEVDRAIWQIDYLITQSKMLVKWYLPTLLVLFVASDFIEGDFGWGAVFMLVVFVAGYFGGRWEINRCYIPRREELKSLRATLLATPE